MGGGQKNVEPSRARAKKMSPFSEKKPACYYSSKGGAGNFHPSRGGGGPEKCLCALFSSQFVTMVQHPGTLEVPSLVLLL